MEKHKSRACNLAKKCKKKEDDYFLVTLSFYFLTFFTNSSTFGTPP